MPSIELNQHIGKVLRRRRRLLELTQAQVAQSCGVRFQQIQKYECGGTTISAARLWQLACALRVDITYFFSGLDGFTLSPAPADPLDSAAR